MFPRQPPGQSQLNSFSSLQRSDPVYFTLENRSKHLIQSVTATLRVDWPWCKAKYYWHSVDEDFAMGLSAIWDHSPWYRISLMVFWQPFFPHHVHCSLSLHSSSIMHISSLKYTLQYPLIVDDNTEKSSSVQLILIFIVRFAQKTAFVCKMHNICITTHKLVN